MYLGQFASSSAYSQVARLEEETRRDAAMRKGLIQLEHFQRLLAGDELRQHRDVHAERAAFAQVATAPDLRAQHARLRKARSRDEADNAGARRGCDIVRIGESHQAASDDRQTCAEQSGDGIGKSDLANATIPSGVRRTAASDDAFGLQL